MEGRPSKRQHSGVEKRPEALELSERECGALAEGVSLETKAESRPERLSDSMRHSHKRSRLDSSASLDAGSSRHSDVTSISLQRLKDLFMSPTVSCDPNLRQEMVQNINATLLQAKGAKIQEARALLADLASMASVKSNESVQSLEELPYEPPITSSGSPFPVDPGAHLRRCLSLAQTRAQTSLPRSLETRPRLTAEEGSLASDSLLDQQLPRTSGQFTIHLPAHPTINAPLPCKSRAPDSPRRTETFRVYSNTFHDDNKAVICNAQRVLPPASSTRTERRSTRGDGGSRITSPWAGDGWTEKSELRSKASRSQISNDTMLPKAASAGPTIGRANSPKVQPQERHYSTPDLPPASSSSMARVMTPSAFREESFPASRPGVRASWPQMRAEPEAVLPERESTTEARIHSSKLPLRDREQLAAAQALARARSAEDLPEARHLQAISRQPPLPGYCATPAAMDPLTMQWLQTSLSYPQRDGSIMTNPMPGLTASEFLQRRPSGPSGIMKTNETSVEPSAWEDAGSRLYKPVTGANALPSIMALSSMQAIRQKGARDQLASQLAAMGHTQAMRDFYRSQPLPGSADVPTLAPAFSMARKALGNESIDHQLQDMQLKAMEAQALALPPDVLQQALNAVGGQAALYGAPHMQTGDSPPQPPRDVEMSDRNNCVEFQPEIARPTARHDFPTLDSQASLSPLEKKRSRGPSRSVGGQRMSSAGNTSPGESGSNKSDEEEQAAEILLSLVRQPDQEEAFINSSKVKPRKPKAQRPLGRR